MTSISHGTLRTQDLLRAFADTLEERSGNDHQLITEARENASILDLPNHLESDAQTAQDVLGDLEDRLAALAPEGYYFGAHEGDSSDFGFWRIEQ